MVHCYVGPRGCDGKSLIVQTVFLDTISSDEYDPLALSHDTMKVSYSLTCDCRNGTTQEHHFGIGSQK